MSDDDFELDLETFKYIFLNVGNLVLWLPAFCLAALLRVITHKWDHQLIFPICKLASTRFLEVISDSHALCSDFCIIPAVFYVVVAATGIDLPHLRTAGWLFDMRTSHEPWWHFYTLFGNVDRSHLRKVDADGRRTDFKLMSWTAFWSVMPTQFAL